MKCLIIFLLSFPITLGGLIYMLFYTHNIIPAIVTVTAFVVMCISVITLIYRIIEILPMRY